MQSTRAPLVGAKVAQTPRNQDEAHIRLLQDIAVAANQSMRPEDALAKALAIICAATDWPVGHALVRTLVVGELHSAGIWYPADLPTSPTFLDFQRVSQTYGFCVGIGLSGHVLAAGEPVFLADFDVRDDCPRRSLAQAAGLHCGLGVPVRTGDQTVAVLEFYAPAKEPPTPEFLVVMREVGLQLGHVFSRSARHAVLNAAGRHVKALLDTCPEAFIESDCEDRIVEWSYPAEAMFGWTREEALGRTVADTIVPPEYREAHRVGIRRLVATGTPKAFGKYFEIAGLRRNGTEFPIEITMWSSRGHDTWSFCALLRDITRRKAAEELLTRRANYDTLTGLPNRSLVMERLAALIGRESPGCTGPAVLFVDLDHFKRINDSVGHEAGDQVLIAVADRFRHAVRPGDTVARLAGDEFLIVCPDIKDYAEAATVAERVLASLSNPVHVGSDNVFLTASIGIALPEGATDADTLIGAADLAMYKAKHAGRAGYELFDQKARQVATSRLKVENELREAVTRGELRLHYQPLIRVADGTVGAVEALMRWQHPTRGLLQPSEFIPVAEETGLIVPMGAWAIKEACRRAEEWCQAKIVGRPLHLSVNLSARQLAQSDLVATIERILAGAAIDPQYVEFGIEVTETMAMRDVEASTKILHALRALGIRLSIDDFGIGYSSLAYLGRLPADTLKVDMSFVQRIVTDPVSRAIVRSVVDLAHALKMTVVAEGVETPAQAAALRVAGVDLFQGFLFARPLPPAELLQFALACRQTRCDTSPMPVGEGEFRRN